ncbi:MAG: ribosome maturation factor RimP [Candidatus Hydrogenedentes bacterium]|nr:ribosome maturation factor RimP [Candidatus Hydrogenedentota bacterium]
MDANSLVRQLWPVVETDLQLLGYELVELEIGKQGSSLLLRVFIDNVSSSISLDDCTKASRMLSPLLDNLEFMPEDYFLELSSPGLNRPIRKLDHFKRYTDSTVEVTVITPVEGRRRFKGVLTEVGTDTIHLDLGSANVTLHLNNIKKARLDRPMSSG